MNTNYKTFEAKEHFKDTINPALSTCQLLLAITGSERLVRDTLQRILVELDNSYGKPVQGITMQFDGTTEVITPVWKGKKY